MPPEPDEFLPLRPPHRRNVVYAETPSAQLLLDLSRPALDAAVPVVLSFHAGGWRSGSKDHCRLRWLTRYGFAVASVNYRLLPHHRFPAQLEDAKSAVRFLRRNAGEFGLIPDQFAAAGLSAGAYLACMLGLTHGHPALDAPPDRTPVPDRMSHPGLPAPADAGDPGAGSTAVQAVLNVAGLVDFLEIQRDPTRRGDRAARAPEGRLLGHAVRDNPERARRASPMHHVRPDAPPFLHLHGDRNEAVPLDQTRHFHAALRDAGVESKMVLVRGAGHNSRRLTDTPSLRDRIADFFHRHLGTDGMRSVQERLRDDRPAKSA
ncbi:MAG: alpha/beta hydrolase [Planctomycetota bacterium]